MTNSVGFMTSGCRRRSVWLRRRLVAVWPLLRVLLQISAGLAMLRQHEAIALTLTGVATLLEIVQDRYTAHGQGRPLRRRPDLPPSSAGRCRPAQLMRTGDPSPDQKLDTPDDCAECHEFPTMSEARS